MHLYAADAQRLDKPLPVFIRSRVFSHYLAKPLDKGDPSLDPLYRQTLAIVLQWAGGHVPEFGHVLNGDRQDLAVIDEFSKCLAYRPTVRALRIKCPEKYARVD